VISTPPRVTAFPLGPDRGPYFEAPGSARVTAVSSPDLAYTRSCFAAPHALFSRPGPCGGWCSRTALISISWGERARGRRGGRIVDLTPISCLMDSHAGVSGDRATRSLCASFVPIVKDRDPILTVSEEDYDLFSAVRAGANPSLPPERGVDRGASRRGAAVRTRSQPDLAVDGGTAAQASSNAFPRSGLRSQVGKCAPFERFASSRLPPLVAAGRSTRNCNRETGQSRRTVREPCAQYPSKYCSSEPMEASCTQCVEKTPWTQLAIAPLNREAAR